MLTILAISLLLTLIFEEGFPWWGVSVGSGSWDWWHW